MGVDFPFPQKFRQLYVAPPSVKLDGVAEEVFVPVDSLAEARFVEGLNDRQARAAKRARLECVKRRGEVHEVAMPDTVAALHEEAEKKRGRRVWV